VTRCRACPSRSAAGLAALLVLATPDVAPRAGAEAVGDGRAGDERPAAAADRPRLRDLGVAPGIVPPGPLNAITDVAGVAVGHRTVVEGDAVRTGVTAILPHGGDLFRDKVPAAVFVGNAFGKAAGFLQVRELGTIETPIVLTHTLAVGTAVDAVVRWTLARPGHEDVRSVNALVGETNDGWLHDVRGGHVTAAHVHEAIAAARPGPVAEGSVGAGTGTRALGWKGGIGTASRRLPPTLGGWTVGALVQSNFGGVLTIAGVPVGEELGRHAFREELETAAAQAADAAAPGGPTRDPARRPPGPASGEEAVPARSGGPPPGDGSVMIVLATDAPLSPRDLERLAARALLGLGRVGSFMSHGSGDFVVAFSTAYLPDPPTAAPVAVPRLSGDALSPLFLATVEAVEEAIYNSLLRATTVTGRDGHTAEAIPIDALREILCRYGRGRPGTCGQDFR